MNFAPNHDNHDGRWVLCKDSLPLCIGCVVEILEDLDSTPTKQKHTLTAFLCLCSSKPAEVYSVLTPEDPATIHFLSLLHGLIWSQDRRLASIAVEAIVNMCSHVKSQDLMMSLLNSLITKILQTKPGAPIVAGLSLISHLCQAFPVLVPPLLLNQGEFVHYLLAALDVEDEEIQAAIVYTMSSVYGDGNLSVDLYYPLSHNILQLLDGAQSKQLLTNILGFLRKLLQQRPLTEKLMNYSGKVSLTSVLKKILLQTSDTSIRIAVVQSLCQILTHNEIYAETLLQADIAEFLYETLATMDHLLIGSVFCCLLLLSGCKDFYSKCHSVYGLEAIIRAIKHCIQANHVKEGAKGFQMLGEILAKQPEGIPIFTNANTPQQVFSLVSAGLRLHNKTLTISASIAMNSSLRVHHLGNKVDLEIIENTVQECLMEIKHQLSLSCKSRTQESLLRSMVLLLHQCFRLTLQWQESSLVKFNDKKSLEEFEIFLLQACDSSCIPSVVANYGNIKSEEVLANLFGMLSAANQMKIGGIQEFYEKLVSASFLQIALSVKSSCQNRPRVEHTVNGFVMSVCERLFAVDHQPDVQNLLMIMKTTFPTVKGDVQDMIEHLQEDNINGVTSEQTVYLTLLYLAACHGDRIIEESILFSIIETFLRNHADVASLPTYTVKFLLLLHAVCHQHVESSNATEGCALLVQGLTRLSDLSSVYTHHPAVLQWCFSTPVITPTVTRNLVTLWLTSVKQKSSSDLNLLKEILASDTSCILIMLDILTSSSADVGQIIVTLIKDFIMTSTIAEEVLVKIATSLTEMLQKLLLHPQPDKGQLKLLLPLLCQVHLKSSPHIPSNVINLKLLYHVCKLFTRSYSEDIEVQFHGLNYLNLTLIQAAGQTDNPVLSMVLSNNHLFTLLEDWSKLDCLPGYLSTTLTTIALLVHLFHKHKTQVDYRIAFDVQYLVSLVSGKHTALVQASALHLWSVVLSTKFSGSFVTFKLGSERSLLSDKDVNLAIPTRHLQQLYILAQNVIVVQDNEVLQCHAVSCLYHLLMYSKQDHNFRNHLVHQPWNVRLLELSLDWCVHKNTLPLSALYLLYTLHAFPGISNTMKLNYKEKMLPMLEEVTARESILPTLYIDNVMLPSFLSHDTVWYDDIKTTADKLTSLLRLDS